MHFKQSYLLYCMAFIIVCILAACALAQTPPAPEKISVEVTRIVQVTTAPQVVEVTREVKVRIPRAVTVTPTPGPADDCFAKAMTQVELNGCANLYASLARQELEALLASLDLPDDERKGLEKLQQEWRANMERDCEHFYGRIITDENGGLHYWHGSMAPMLRGFCEADATIYRIKQLEEAYFPEGR